MIKFLPNKTKLFSRLLLAAVVVLVVGIFSFGLTPSVVLAQNDSPTPEERIEAQADEILDFVEDETNDVTAIDTSKDKDPGGIDGLLLELFRLVFGGIIALEGWILRVLTKILVAVAQYNGFVKALPVKIGWTLVRDLSNLFFVVILLAISIATILRVESYNFKKLLPKVVIMAVLVNFSLLIAGLIIDFAQVVMLTFVAAFSAEAGGDFFAALRIQQMLIGREQLNAITGFFSLFVTSLFVIILLLIAAVTVLVMVVVLIARMVMLWFLLILSPLAYILAAFPQGQRYAQQWWQEFTKYVIVGPVLAFFLWLSLAVVSQQDQASQLNFQSEFLGDSSFNLDETFTTAVEAGDDLPGSEGGVEGVDIFTQIGETTNFFFFIISVAMLLGGLVVTQQMGVAGGSLAGAMYGRIRQAGVGAALMPLKIAWGATKFAGRRVSDVEKAWYGAGGFGLNPLRVYRGLQTRYDLWQKRMERQGATKGAAAASEELKSKRKLTRAKGLARLFTSSPATFTEYFWGFKGIGRMAKTFWKGTSVDEMREWEKERKGKVADLKMREKLGFVGDITEKGKEILIQDTIGSMSKRFDDKRLIPVVEEKPDGTKELGEMLSADFETFMDSITKKDLARYGLAGKIDLLNDGKKGIDKDSAEDVAKFKEAFFGYNAKTMVEELGKYDDKTTGTIEDVTPEKLRQVGEAYYEGEKNKLDGEITAVEKGGINDAQLAVRQDKLINLNKDIIDILQKIETSGRQATDEDKARINDFVDEGKKLGGKTVIDTKTGLSHFGQNPNDRKNTYQIQRPDDVVGIAAITSEELKQLHTEDELGRIALDQLKEKSKFLSEEAVMATLSTEERRNRQAVVRRDVKIEKENLAKEDLKRRRAAIAMPIPYEALAEMRAAEREELSKLPDSMEWTEIESELNTAIQNKNVARIRALMKKAAIDYNDNEIWRAWGYSEDAEGMRNFGEEVLKKQVGMRGQEMLKFMDDLAYINEDKAHYETSRMVTLDHGVARWSTEAEHAAAVTNENLKKASRAFLQNTNRLGFGGDDQTGQYRLSLSGKLTLAGIGDEELQYRLARGEINPSTLSKVASDREGLQDMVSRGLISSKTMRMIVEAAAKKSITAAYSELLRKAQAFTGRS